MQKQPNLRGIFIEADCPEYLEREIDPIHETVDLGAMNVRDMMREHRDRKTNFDTAPFDPQGAELRFYPAGFTVWSGFPGAGKTTLLRQFVCHLLKHGKGVFVASLEENPVDVFCRLACVALGTTEPTEIGLQWCVDSWNERLKLWSYRRGIAEHMKLFALIRVLAKQGIRHAIIDSLARLDVHSGDWEAQRLFGNALEATAASSGAHVHLVAHPRKPMAADQEPDINDVAGSADIGRLADNVLFVRRQKSEVSTLADVSPMRILIRKQRYHTGACNAIDGVFNRSLKQWKPHAHDDEPTRYLPDGAYAAEAAAISETRYT